MLTCLFCSQGGNEGHKSKKKARMLFKPLCKFASELYAMLEQNYHKVSEHIYASKKHQLHAC